VSNYSLEVKKVFSVPSNIIYDAWLDPEAIKVFMRPADVVTVPNPEIDATVGGTFLFNMHAGENILPHKGEYKILDRPNKIQFTWNSMNTKNEDSLVTITINSIDENSCELTLVHELLPSEASRDDHNGGWTNILKNLGLISNK
jgi:uncharacterized protein YndB with AHSA1/START domain